MGKSTVSRFFGRGSQRADGSIREQDEYETKTTEKGKTTTKNEPAKYGKAQRNPRD